MSQNEQEKKAFIDQKSAEYTRRLVAAVPKTDAELRDFAKEMLGQIPKNTPETDLFIEGWRRAFSKYHELLPGIKKVSDILVKELGDPQSVTDIDQLLADLPDQLKEAEAWLSSKKRATKDSREKVNRVVGIAGNRYRQEALAELRQREENLLFNIWPEYKQYVAWRDANPTITSGSPQDANYLNTLNARFAGMNNASWNNPDVSTVFQQAYDLEKLVAAGTASPEDINNRLNQLRQASDAAEQGISEVQIVYWRLHSQVEHQQKKLQRMLTAEDIRQLKDAVRAMSGEIDNFNSLLESLQLALLITTQNNAGTAPQNLLFIDPQNRAELEAAYIKVVQAPILPRLRQALNAVSPALAGRFDGVVNQLLREAQVLLGEYTGDYQDVFPGDAQLEAWLFSENQEYFERFEEVRDLYDRVVVANNDPVAGDSDRVDFLLEYFAKQIDQLDRSDRAFNRRFITLDIQVNNLKAVRRKIESVVANGVNRINVQPTNFDYPVAEDFPAWKVFYDKLRTTHPDTFPALVKQHVDNLEAEEMAYSKQALFSQSNEGRPYQYLSDYLSTLATSSEPSDKKYYKEHLVTYHENLRRRLLFIDKMGPYGDSALGSGDFEEWFKFFPEFSADDFQYFYGTRPYDAGKSDEEKEHNRLENNFEYGADIRAISDRIEEYMTEEVGDFVEKQLVSQIDEKGDPIPLAEVLEKVTEGTFSFDRSRWMSGEGQMHKKIADRLKSEFLKNAKRSKEVDALGVETTYWNNVQSYGEPGVTRKYSDAEIDGIIRMAYTMFVLSGGRVKIFMNYLAVGISPPPLHKMDKMMENYPIVVALNNASKGKSEILDVVMGADIPQYYFETMAQKIGIFIQLARQANDGNDDYAWARYYTTLHINLNNGEVITGNLDGSFSDAAGQVIDRSKVYRQDKESSMEVVNFADKKQKLRIDKTGGAVRYFDSNNNEVTGVKVFFKDNDIYKNKKWSEIVASPPPRAEHAPSKILNWIREDHRPSESATYTRFQTLLIYHESSRLHSKALGIEGTVDFHMVDSKGNTLQHEHHAAHPPHGGHGHDNELTQEEREQFIYLPSFVISPWEFFTGKKAEYFAKNKTRIDQVYQKTQEFATAFHHDIIAEPPSLKGGAENLHSDINLLVEDFEKVLAHTSKMKTGIELINWPEVKEAYVQRLRILFAVFQNAHPGVSPHKRLRSTTERVQSAIAPTLEEAFVTAIQQSGQTLQGTKVSGDELTFDSPFANDGRLTMQQFLIDFITGYDSTQEARNAQRPTSEKIIRGVLAPIRVTAKNLGYIPAAMFSIDRLKGDYGKTYDTLYQGSRRLNFFNRANRRYKNFRRRFGIPDYKTIGENLLPHPKAAASAKKAEADTKSEGKVKH